MGMSIEADIEPFVIKEKEIVGRAMHFRPRGLGVENVRTEERGELGYPFPSNSAQRYAPSMCAVFFVATPSEGLAFKGINIGSSLLGSEEGGGSMRMSIYSEPLVIHREVRNPFWW